MALIEEEAPTAAGKLTPLFIDIGANLSGSQFKGFYHGSNRRHEPDLIAVLARAKEARVDKIIVTVGDLRDAKEVSKLCAELDPEKKFLFYTFGVHPTNAKQLLTPTSRSKFAEVLASTDSTRLVAAGELGLDYDRLQYAPKEAQLECFRWQLKYFMRHTPHLPFFFHVRGKEALNDFCMIVEQTAREVTGCCDDSFSAHVKGVVHSYTESFEGAEQILALGLDLGLTGVSFREAASLEVVRRVPIDRLHLETDAPWCEIKASHASWPYVSEEYKMERRVRPDRWVSGCKVKGRFEPADMVHVARTAAAIRGIRGTKNDDDLSFDEFCSIIYKNTMRLFFSRLGSF